MEDILIENGYSIEGWEEAVEYPEYRDALIGFTDDFRLVYDYDEIVRILMERDGATLEDAQDYVDFNLVGVNIFGRKMPLIITRLNVKE